MARTKKQHDASFVVVRQQGPVDSTEPIGTVASAGENDDAGDRRDRVALRAYELYLARGGSDGADFDDWLAAERELVNGGHESAAVGGGHGRGDTGE